jgi:regulatory protein
MQITALQPQVKNPERINIFVDGTFFLGISALVVLQAGLAIGQELSDAQMTQLRSEGALQEAIERSMNYLSYRPRSREEVRRYLHGKQTPPEMIEAVLTRLESLDLVNDRTFASFWLDSRAQFSPRGARALKNELRQKGVQREVVDELLEEADEDGTGEEARALVAGRKKALTLLRSPDIDFQTFRTRLGPFLQRRGFNYDVSTRVVRTLWDELCSG